MEIKYDPKKFLDEIVLTEKRALKEPLSSCSPKEAPFRLIILRFSGNSFPLSLAASLRIWIASHSLLCERSQRGLSETY